MRTYFSIIALTTIFITQLFAQNPSDQDHGRHPLFSSASLVRVSGSKMLADNPALANTLHDEKDKSDVGDLSEKSPFFDDYGRKGFEKNDNEHWVGTWGTAVHGPDLGVPGLANTGFSNQTLRQIVHASVGGYRVRVRFSAFGANAVTIGSAHIALHAAGPMIVPASDRTLTFGGKPSITIPAGALVLSDPVDLDVPALSRAGGKHFRSRKYRSCCMALRSTADPVRVPSGRFHSQPLNAC
jgi:hypothetical protein